MMIMTHLKSGSSSDVADESLVQMGVSPPSRGRESSKPLVGQLLSKLDVATAA